MSPNSVRIAPGSMIETCTPCGASSMRIASLSASTAYLLAWYQPPRGSLTCPATEAMLMIRPEPAARMCGRTSWLIRETPSTLTSSWRRVTSTGTSSTAPKGRVPGVVHEHVDPAVLGDDLVDEGDHRGVVGDVDGVGG